MKKSLFIQTILSPGLERGNFEAVLDTRDQIIRTWASWRRKLRGLADWRHGHRGETISWEKEGGGDNTIIIRLVWGIESQFCNYILAAKVLLIDLLSSYTSLAE